MEALRAPMVAGISGGLMNVWLTSDLHISHAKVAETRGYPDIAHHDKYLAGVWDAVVHPDDHVWVLGDISAGGSAAQKNALQWIKQRRGYKHLIAGNHDGCHPIHRDSHKWQAIYFSAFDSVQMVAKRRVPLLDGHVSVMLSHFPYAGDRGEDRYPEWRLRDHGYPIIHGHTHSSEVVSWARPWKHDASPLQIHVGIDAWQRLVNWDEICQIVQESHE
ncbi:metallophosphoesterase family protein [Mycolicibacterium septicum]|uniref:metallophosphoesterase family protein n=1 Tax=Mycolicibacterium septicum TaxID=98668 RepID=UPI001AF7AA3B|nr:metallophosphoesterase [Mycolicibacterium septicum]QRY51790.1 metallophosphoesterase [Mycolicibacterium septicum]